MIVLNELPLLVSIIFLDDTISTKPDPLYEIVELFALICRGTNSGSQLRVRDVLEKEDGSGDPTKFGKGGIKLVLSAIGTKPSKNC